MVPDSENISVKTVLATFWGVGGVVSVEKLPAAIYNEPTHSEAAPTIPGGI